MKSRIASLVLCFFLIAGGSGCPQISIPVTDWDQEIDLSGRVTDKDTGAPVVGASVGVVQYFDDINYHDPYTTTDADGAYHFTAPVRELAATTHGDGSPSQLGVSIQGTSYRDNAVFANILSTMVVDVELQTIAPIAGRWELTISPDDSESTEVVGLAFHEGEARLVGNCESTLNVAYAFDGTTISILDTDGGDHWYDGQVTATLVLDASGNALSGELGYSCLIDYGIRGTARAVRSNP